MAEIFLASRNAKKLAEMQRILAEHVPDVRVLGLDDVPAYDEPAETEPTFEGNARLKALAAVAATGLPSLADDSGICVDALNGMPGVLSARWAGVTDADRATKDLANNELLLAQLSDVPDARRTAQFRCAVVLARPTPDGVVEEVAEGVMAGRVIRGMRGAGGFGYDVLFCADGYDLTTAELPIEEKDAISHRGKALRAIAPLVARMLAVPKGGLEPPRPKAQEPKSCVSTDSTTPARRSV
jgi:XTP/dITP diphosphohydrolase